MGRWTDHGELVAVLLKYYGNYIPYATGEFDARGFAEIITSDPDFQMMSGLKAITSKMEPYLPAHRRKRQMYYAKCTELKGDWIDDSEVVEAVPDDAEQIVQMLNAIPEFAETVKLTAERKRKSLENGVSRTFFIKKDGKIVSTASTTAENSMSAMIVAVATVQGYKRKGYATVCLVKLCKQLLSEGKELCLFYDNPEAGTIYKRIGFEEIGLWMLYAYERD